MIDSETEEAIKHIKMLLGIIEHETNLPEGAANGNVAPNGRDEGVVLTARILNEARVFQEETEKRLNKLERG